MAETKKTSTKKTSNASKSSSDKKVSNTKKSTTKTSSDKKVSNTKKSTTKKSTSTKRTGAAKKSTTQVKKAKEKTVENINSEAEIKEEKVVKEEIVNEPVIEVAPKKKKSVEEIRIIIMLCFLGLLAFVYIISSYVTYKKADDAVNKVKELKASDKISAIYLMKQDCQYCEINKPNMKTLKDTYGLDYFEVDVSSIGSERRNTILDELGIDSSKFGTPTLVLTKNNETLEVLSGVQAFDELFYSLKSYNLISEDKELYLNYIDYNGYKAILNSSTPEILVLTSTTCHYCIEERPILEEIAKQYNVKINWIYLNGAFTSQEDYDEFNSSLTWFTNNSNWGTPTTLVIQNGEVISALSGYREKDEIIKFYKQNGFISE